jgi:hypothetical protein
MDIDDIKMRVLRAISATQAIGLLRQQRLLISYLYVQL